MENNENVISNIINNDAPSFKDVITSIRANSLHINVKLLDEGAKIPTYGSPDSAGSDLYALVKENDGKLHIQPGETKVINTGISIEIPPTFVGLIFARSGKSIKEDLAPANKVGVIDSDYRGEILVALHNHGTECRVVTNGEKIAQISYIPYFTANYKVSDELSDTKRGDGKFGSTGKF